MKKSRDLNLKPGEHDSNSASQVLGVSKIKLLKTLREVGFLYIDTKNGINGDRHNLPRDGIKKLGWAYTQKLTFGTGPNRERDREYFIVIFTRRGFVEVKKIMENPDSYEMPDVPTDHHSPTTDVAPHRSKKAVQQQAEPAHQSCLNDLEKMGLGIGGSTDHLEKNGNNRRHNGH